MPPARHIACVELTEGTTRCRSGCCKFPRCVEPRMDVPAWGLDGCGVRRAGASSGAESPSLQVQAKAAVSNLLHLVAHKLITRILQHTQIYYFFADLTKK